MRTALVFPRTRYPTGDPPLGVAYLAAALSGQTGDAPAVIDTTFEKDPVSAMRAALSRERFDLVGISAMVTMSREAALAARLAKEINPDCMVIVGGPHATTLPGEVLKEPAVDAVCVGEGERAIIEVARRGGFRGVPGMGFRGGCGEFELTPAESVGDLDELAFPALELLPMEDYFENWFQLDSAAHGVRGTTVLATRGCPFKCSYCQPTLDKLFGPGVRKRSPANVADELEERMERFGIGGFIFADDTFIADRKWVGSFCAELGGRDLGLIWGCNVRADLVSRELLRDMRDAGLRKVYIGIEVYDDERRREVFNKKLTREHVEAAVSAARSLGIGTQGYFMLGAPGERRGDVWDTARYARRLDLDDATFNLTTPLPATYLYERFGDRISVSAEEMDYYHRYALRPEHGVDQAFLSRAQLLAYAGFYLRPRRLWRQFRSLFEPGGAARFMGKLRRVL